MNRVAKAGPNLGELKKATGQNETHCHASQEQPQSESPRAMINSLSVHSKAIKCIYDPLLPYSEGSTTDLGRQLTRILREDHGNSILISPSVTLGGVPWFSSFKFCRQNKYWREAELACRELLPMLHDLANTDGAYVPVGFETPSDVKREKKETMFVDTVLGCGIYMHPNASSKRIALITQALLVLWTHDDTVEYSPDHLGQTAADHIMSGFDLTSPKSLSTSNPFFAAIFSEFFTEDQALGQELAQSMLAFVHNTCTQQAAKSTHFSTLRAYLDFRSVDFGREFNFAAIKFARDIHLSAEETVPFKRLTDIADDHHMLINDLYSFAKELEESETEGKPLINAVKVVKDLFGMATFEDAKRTVKDMVLQWEDMSREELAKMHVLREKGELNIEQWSYMEGIFQSMSGNHFFSATASRYYRNTI